MNNLTFRINREKIKARHYIIKAIRNFFYRRGYIEVDTPALTMYPGIDAYIDAVEVSRNRFLITSPEIHMKILISQGMEKIFQICHAYREGEKGKWHNIEFTMLEWYKTNSDYRALMNETEQLILSLNKFAKIELPHPFERITVSQIFTDTAGWNPVEKWDEERFYIDMVEKVEPVLKNYKAVFLYDYPSGVSSMAKLKDDQPLLCERFELYISGIELVNGYSELTDAHTQLTRFKKENEKRAAMNKNTYPVSEQFLIALQSGFPKCAGAALGIDRLITILMGDSELKEIMPFKED